MNLVGDCAVGTLGPHRHRVRRFVVLERLRVFAIAVGEHHHLVAHAPVLAPGIHDEDVVYRHAGDRIHAPGSQLRRVIDESRQVIHRASRRKRTGY